MSVLPPVSVVSIIVCLKGEVSGGLISSGFLVGAGVGGPTGFGGGHIISPS